jgi:hypothetical protein
LLAYDWLRRRRKQIEEYRKKNRELRKKIRKLSKKRKVVKHKQHAHALALFCMHIVRVAARAKDV